MKEYFEIALIVSIVSLLVACNDESDHPLLFSKLPSSETGIDFINRIENSEDYNIFTYRNFYNGGGVGIGDINNDGLNDVLLTSNLGSNKLYLNKGNFKFEDITFQSGVGDETKWSTGVVFVDINHDGWLDIYVCNAGYRSGSNQKNSFYINNKNLTFTERAEEIGLDDSGYTTHAGFFDYDQDGDLDVYMLNNSFIPVNTLNYNNKRELVATDWPVKDFLKGGGDKLYRNDDGKFVDVSKEAGIYGSLIGFGLGVNIADLNNDRLPDIYVCNDFFERDYYYVNKGDGTFSESLEDHFQHISLSSMGADIGDLNNDGYLDLFVTDMLPAELTRLKTTATFENIDVQKLKEERGFYHQFMQNSFQLNDGGGNFKDLAYYAGVAASDWSWGALIFDADGDTRSDLFVSNGIYHDVIDQDFIDFFANDVIQKMTLSGEKESVEKIINEMPSVPIRNSFFRNMGSYQFTDRAEEWGLKETTYSNGAAYGDLDNDGDLDLVINNVNQDALVYRNENETNYCKIILKDGGENTFSIGAEVKLFLENSVLTRIQNPTRGFQSSVPYDIVFGLGDIDKIDSVIIYWPDKTVSKLLDVGVNTTIEVRKDSVRSNEYVAKKNEKLSSYLTPIDDTLMIHREDSYIDFYKERNLSVMTSKEGPTMAVADVNDDGYDDLYVGGAANQMSVLYISKEDGSLKEEQIFEDSEKFEDTASEFIDVDGDGDLDLYVGTGGNHLPIFSPYLQDRLYINDGNGKFTRDFYGLPKSGMNTSVIAAYDFDKDGDEDLVIGSRNIPGNYGISPVSYVLLNEKGKFKDVTKDIGKQIYQAGLITDAAWTNLVGDENKELVLVGEWMSPIILQYKDQKFQRINVNLDALNGWWQHVNSCDLDNDGDLDLILGNKGSNFYLKPSMEQPLKLWLGDFTNDGKFETVMTQYLDGKDRTVASMRDLTEQFSFLKKRKLRHSDYARSSFQELFGEDVVKTLSVKTVNFPYSVVAYNDRGRFRIDTLPPEIQFSSVNETWILDLNNDQYLDLIVAGNQFGYLPQFSRQDASSGDILLNRNGKLMLMDKGESGLNLKGMVNDIQQIGDKIIFGQNDDQVAIYKLKPLNEN